MKPCSVRRCRGDHLTLVYFFFCHSERWHTLSMGDRVVCDNYQAWLNNLANEINCHIWKPTLFVSAAIHALRLSEYKWLFGILTNAWKDFLSTVPVALSAVWIMTLIWLKVPLLSLSFSRALYLLKLFHKHALAGLVWLAVSPKGFSSPLPQGYSFEGVCLTDYRLDLKSSGLILAVTRT